MAAQNIFPQASTKAVESLCFSWLKKSFISPSQCSCLFLDSLALSLLFEFTKSPWINNGQLSSPLGFCHLSLTSHSAPWTATQVQVLTWPRLAQAPGTPCTSPWLPHVRMGDWISLFCIYQQLWLYSMVHSPFWEGSEEGLATLGNFFRKKSLKEEEEREGEEAELWTLRGCPEGPVLLASAFKSPTASNAQHSLWISELHVTKISVILWHMFCSWEAYQAST